MATVQDAVKEELEVLESSVAPRLWVFNDGQTEKTYEQKPLTWFGKIEFFSLLGDAVDGLSTEERPLNLGELLGGEATTDSFVAVLSRIAGQAPEVLQEAYCIWLNVPRGERDWAKWTMEQNMTDEEGMEVIDRFVDQNAEALQSFFGEKGQSLMKKISLKFGLSGPAPSSKPSKRTQPATAQESKK
jgi:hypothetical protein